VALTLKLTELELAGAGVAATEALDWRTLAEDDAAATDCSTD